ncbi:tail fiber protein [Jejuia spongiicola]|uniref:Tail fiber protein n=1 Tax=Jejuia spongiicola TaxID=2942207 RepID=A0ABT0QCY0_9FLAO|nr:tail fiber protein [Jejuia spongiicola]MCL6294840.1 tail fiber protein [Jejuia spongiicola]
MKKILIIFILSLFTVTQLNAQTNTFPTSGNVGIGTTNTSNGVLTINGNATNSLRLENDVLNKESSMRFRSKSSNGGTLHSDISLYATGNNQGYLGFKVPHNNTVNSGYDMIINHSGHMGIGTTNPASRLHILHVSGEGNAPIISGNIATFQTNGSSGYYASINVVGGSAGKSSLFFGDKDSGAMGGLRYNNANNSLSFRTNGNDDKILIDDNGNVGIGNVLPTSKLYIKQSFDNNTGGLSIADASASRLIQIYGEGSAGRQVIRTSGTSNPLAFDLNGIEKMRINSNGNIGIGTTTPDAKLAVKGNIHTNEVKVDLLGAVAPDYVFYKDYDLKTLNEVESYITKEGHLPNIPSAKEMETNGLLLKEMNLKLLEKIEELTLYTINQEKRIKTLEQENNVFKKQQKRIKLLEEQMALLLKIKE